MRIAVTGGNGFIGRHVVAQASRRGHAVRSLVGPHGVAVASGNVEAAAIDLRKPDGLAAALAGVDVVVHCAAALDGDLATQAAITVEGTRNLLAAMKDADVRDIVLIGSFAVYDYTAIPADARLDETTPLEARAAERAPYIKVKQEQEALVRQANGIAWTIIRPAIVFGPGRTWFHHLGAQLGRRFWVCLAPDSALPVTHVENCAEAIVLAAENKQARGEVLNVVDDELPRRRDYMAELQIHEPSRPAMVTVSWNRLTTLSRLASLAGSRAPGPLNPVNLNARCKPLQYDNARAKRILGWSPRLDWRHGLSQALGAAT